MQKRKIRSGETAAAVRSDLIEHQTAVQSPAEALPVKTIFKL
jgi:hypothetical protein